MYQFSFLKLYNRIFRIRKVYERPSLKKLSSLSTRALSDSCSHDLRGALLLYKEHSTHLHTHPLSRYWRTDIHKMLEEWLYRRVSFIPSLSPPPILLLSSSPILVSTEILTYFLIVDYLASVPLLCSCFPCHGEQTSSTTTSKKYAWAATKDW